MEDYSYIAAFYRFDPGDSVQGLDLPFDWRIRSLRVYAFGSYSALYVVARCDLIRRLNRHLSSVSLFVVSPPHLCPSGSVGLDLVGCCPSCGSFFLPSSPSRVYCSLSCKRSAQNARSYRRRVGGQ